MKNFASSRLALSLFAGALGVGVSACGGGGGSTAGGTDGDSAFNARVLWCSWRDDENGPLGDYVYARKFCIRSGACTSLPTALCAYNVFGNKDAWEKFTLEYNGNAVWEEDALCDETCPVDSVGYAVEAGRVPFPECASEDPAPYEPATYGACEPSNPPPDWWDDFTTGGTPTTGAESTGGTPTTGAESTGGDTTTTGGADTDGPNIEPWICSQYAHNNCQVRSGSGLNADNTHCWSAITTEARCVYAANLAEAEAACECLCAWDDEGLSVGCDTPGVCEVDLPLDCSTPYPDGPELLEPGGHTCNGIVDAATAMGMCPNNGKVFDASATLILADGTTTAVTGLVGYLHYEVSGCSSGTCGLIVKVLEISPEDLAGAYFRGTAVGGTYAIGKLRVHMKEPLEGTWYQARQTVVFSGDPFWAVASMTGITVDSVGVPAEPVTFGTNQIVGDLDSAMSELTLNFSFNVPGGTATLSLTTR